MAKKKDRPAVLSGELPEWASTEAIAQLLGKGTRRIQQYTQDGILPTEIPPGGGHRKYRLRETIERYIAYKEEKVQGGSESGKRSELAVKKLEAEIALKESQGELHKLKTDIAKGEYLLAEQVQSELADFMSVFRRFAEAIPTRMSGILASYVDPATARTMEKSMRKELEAMLTLFVNAAMTEDDPE